MNLRILKRYFDVMQGVSGDGDRYSSTKAMFEQQAEVYENFISSSIQNIMREQKVSLIRKYLKTGPVLDLGMGPGMLIQDMDVARFGIDFSKKMCLLANKKGLPVAQADTLHLPFKKCSFQLIIASLLVHHLNFIVSDGFSLLLEECHRLLKPHGYLIIIESNRRNPSVRLIHWIIREKNFVHLPLGYMLETCRESRLNLRVLSFFGIYPFFFGNSLLNVFADFVAHVPILRWFVNSHYAIIMEKLASQ